MPKRDPLDDYRRKRDPERTTEPFGPAAGAAGRPTRQGQFVVHLHDARRRHYDLRLEMGGTLKSFAVPKGPSLDPEDKRLAVQTEDHPLEYLEFEQVIPEGNYGAGSMIAWDRGLVRYLDGSGEDGLQRGKVDFELHGHKLRGRFALVRTSDRSAKQHDKPQWLLLKKRDAFARAGDDLPARTPRSVLSGLTVEELPQASTLAEQLQSEAAARGGVRRELDVRRLTPMLCSTLERPEPRGPAQDAADAPAEAALRQPGWYYELKLDGVRILAARQGDEVQLRYRTRRPATATYPEVVAALRKMVPDRFVLDGEIIAFDDSGRPSFHRLARRIHATKPLDVRFAARAVPVVYVVFDILALGDYDLRDLPLSDRKRLLRRVVRGPGFVRGLDHGEDDGRPLYALCRQQQLEGLVAKRASSPYVAGERTRDWVKIKCERDDELVVVGHTRGEGKRDELGALDVASYEQGELVVRGKVGSGLDVAAIATLRERLAPLERAECPARGELERAPRGRTFVEPAVVVSIRYSGWTDDGRLRHPVFRGIRDDVEPQDCTAAPRAGDDALLGAGGASSRGEGRARKRGRALLTNQDKVFWPDEGFTKGDLCDYYEAMADAILPYLADRPVVLVRYPDGVAGKSFYQWNLPEGTPQWVRSMPLRAPPSDESTPPGAHGRAARRKGGRRRDEKEVSTFLVDDVDTLLFIANLGAIPIHVLASRASSLGSCDFLTMDFDVGEGQPRDAIVLARSLRELLAEIGLSAYPKTSGQRGLHVLSPLGGVPFDTARTLGELLGRLLVARHPDIATMERIKRKRGPRVYVDTGQIGPTRTIVAPWSVRAHPGATVSTPLDWDEVGFALEPQRYTIATVVERATQQGDPMRPMLDEAPDVPEAVRRLGELLGAG